MKVVLTNDASDIAGGENYVLLLAEGLRHRGIEVVIAPLPDSRLYNESLNRGFITEGVPYGDKGKELNGIYTFIKKIRGHKPDIVHTNSNFDRTIAAFGGRALSAKNITTIHSCLSIKRNPVHAFRNRFLIDHFTPVGHSTKKILTEEDSIKGNRITVVHIGLPENRITFSQDGRNRIRNEFNIASEELLFGTLSRLVPFKGHTYLLKAVKQIADSGYKFKVMIVGEGELMSDLRAETEFLGIKDYIVFAGHREDIRDILSGFDVIVQPSKDFGGETFPVSILESLSVGIPVLASDVGDIRYMVEDKVNGILTIPENVQGLADGLRFFLTGRDNCKLMGEKSRNKFLKEFTAEKMTDNIINVYNNVLRMKATK